METRVEAKLESVLILNIDPGANIEFGIKEINDNLFQVTKNPDDVNSISSGSPKQIVYHSTSEQI